MEKEGVPLARRISGGGAVYHDPGNLNVSVMVPRTEYAEQKQYDLIFQTLEATALRHRMIAKLGKTSLAVDGLKFSGQAFCHRRECTLHHGTLLVDTDLDRLGRYLGPELEGIETRAIASVPAKVANLSQFAPELTVETLSAALIDCFQAMYAPGEGARPTQVELDAVGRVPSPGDVEMLDVQYWSDGDAEKAAGAQFFPMLGKNSSKDWKLGHTPRFTFEQIEVEKGRVVNGEAELSFDDFLKRRRS
jgi:lipoate-protein ligase A